MSDFLDFVRYMAAVALVGWAAVTTGRNYEQLGDR